MTGHPAKCRHCQGAGWKPGPTLTQTVNGMPHRYQTLRECDHDWWNDDPDAHDPYLDDHLPRTHPRALAAYTEGISQGRQDIDGAR